MTHPQCHANRDGDCSWVECPQLLEGEPEKTGRYCPLAKADDLFYGDDE